jgi:hypothetical protein
MGARRTLIIFLLIISGVLDGSILLRVEGRQKRPGELGYQQEPQDDANGQEKQNEKVKPQQESERKAKRQQERPLEVMLFINDVRSAQPEFAADLLMRIAASDKVSDATWKRELIEESFRLASATQQPFKRTALPSSPTDTRTGFLASAFGLNLDTLSLQCRAVNAMLSIDKQRARGLFREITKPQLQPLNCEDALVYDVSDFYATLKRIAETAFSQKEIKNNEPVQLMESYISQMLSPVEIAPVLDLITSTKLSTPQRESLVYVFSKAFGSISGDDHSFTQSLYYVDRGIKNLVTQCQQQGISIDESLRAYRIYLVRHFNAARCADNGLILPRGAQSAVISDFNNDLRLKSEKNILEILADDVKPSKIEGATKVHMHWQSPKASTLLTRIKELRFGSGKTPLTLTERDTLDWETRLSSFMKDLGDWKKEDEKSEEDYFHQKCVLLKSIIQLIPKKTSREDVIRGFVEFLNNFDLNRGSRIEWFWQAKFLFTDTRYFSAPGDSTPSYMIRRSDILPIVESTKNKILYLYLEAEKFLLSGL